MRLRFWYDSAQRDFEDHLEIMGVQYTVEKLYTVVIEEYDAELYRVAISFGATEVR